MYPEQIPTPTPASSPSPIDYLNQITPKPPKRQLFKNKMTMIIFGLAGLVVLVLLVAIISAVLKPNTSATQQLAAKLQATLTISTGAQKQLKSSLLRANNSNLQLYLTNINRDITAPLAKNGINTAKLDTSIVTAESGADITTRLENARLNANYDEVYASEMAYQLSSILTLIHQINTSTHNQSLKDLFKNADSDLDPLQTQFANYNSTQDN